MVHTSLAKPSSEDRSDLSDSGIVDLNIEIEDDADDGDLEAKIARSIITSSRVIVDCLENSLRPRFVAVALLPSFVETDLLILIDSMRARFATFITCAQKGAFSDVFFYGTVATLYVEALGHLAQAKGADWSDAIAPLIRARATTETLASLVSPALVTARARSAAARRLASRPETQSG